MGEGSTQFSAKRPALPPTPRYKFPVAVSLVKAEPSVEAFEDRTEFPWMREALARTQQALETLRETEELHRLLFEKVPHPRFVCDAQTLRLLAVNEAAVRQYGYSRREFLQMKVTELSAPESLPHFHESVHELWARPLPGTDGRNHVFRARKKDGTAMDVKVDAALVRLRGRRVFLLLAEDVTQKRRAEGRWHAQQAATRALAESSTLAEASPKVFQAICEHLGYDWGELWRVDPTANVLRCTQVWHSGTGRLSEMERVARKTIFARGEGIAGTAWLRNKPVWITDLDQYPDFQRASALAKYGLRAVFAFPIRLNREVLGVITIFSRQVQPPDKHLLRLLRDICSQIGQVMGRRRAERQLLEASEREQQRIGQDLHDGLCQQLAGIAYMASDLEARLAKESPRQAVIAARIAALSRETAVQARQIARGLNPVEVGTMGLMAALEELAFSIRSMFSLSCRFECRRRIVVQDHKAAVHLYRIAQEAIHNAIAHGKASEIVVSLRRTTEGIVLSVKDNGRGLFKSWPGGSGMGFENMNYRARSIGARLEFAPRDGGGTVMTCAVSSGNGRLT